LFLESIKQKILKITSTKAAGPVHAIVQEKIKQGKSEERGVTMLGLTEDEFKFLTKTLQETRKQQ